MRSISSIAAAFLALTGFTSGQFVPAPTDLTQTSGYLNIPVRYKEVPDGICELTPGVKSYSGYVDIADDQHIHFWFFEARNEDPHNAPLTVWINGGPGSSSMIGLFQELGPCGIDVNGDVYYNPYAWNNVSNMIFIDQPATVGFSYSTPIPAYTDSGSSYEYYVQLPNNTCPDYAAATGTCGTYSYPNETDTANNTVAAAPGMWRTLQGFMGAFPQYSRHEFNFATESYGGHYGPIFNRYIESQNDLIDANKLPNAHKINLKTLLIGNGWFDPLIQYEAYYNFTVYPGNTYDYSPFNETVQNQMYNALYGPGNCVARTIDCNTRGIDEICSAADNFCAQEVESVLDIYAVRDEYDIREPYDDPFPYSYYVDYLNTPRVQQALGAFVNYSDYSQIVGNAFSSTGDDDREEGTIEALQGLVKRGIYVVQYAGDADYNCNWLGSQVVAEMIDAPGFSSAGFENITTPDGVVNGQVKQSDNYAFVRIYYSGHEVPFYQPALALDMFSRAIAGEDIATGTHRICDQHGGWGGWSGSGSWGSSGGYKTVGPAESTFREGNSTLVFETLPPGATYNTSTHRPNPIGNYTGTGESSGSTGNHLKYRRELPDMRASKPALLARRSGRAFKPSSGKQEQRAVWIKV